MQCSYSAGMPAMDASLASLAQIVIDGLRLEELTPNDIDPQAPLFGGGLGLDSIDALELAVLIERTYGVKIGDAQTGRSAFASLDALHRHITAAKAV